MFLLQMVPLIVDLIQPQLSVMQFLLVDILLPKLVPILVLFLDLFLPKILHFEIPIIEDVDEKYFGLAVFYFIQKEGSWNTQEIYCPILDHNM